MLGISDTHNASAALMGDRVGLVALQEERPTREKNHSGFPYKSIEFVLNHAVEVDRPDELIHTETELIL